MKTSPRPTLKTIAQLTGLAVPTVSRALSGAEDIGIETRKRVRQIADEIGYIPNRAGVRLRTGRTLVISLVLSTEADVMNLTARLINSVAAALRQTSYHLTITPYFPDEDPMRPIKHLVETNAADAVIINQVQPQDPRVQYLLDRNFPFAAHGRSDWSKDHAYYDFDNAKFAELAIERLAARGRKRLAVLAPPLEQNYAVELVQGARSAADQQAVELELIEDMHSDSPSDVIEARFNDMFSQELRYDGVIFASANACMAAVTGVERAKKSVGSDVDFFAKEAIPFLQRFRPDILSLQEDAWSAGDFLARAAIERIEKPENPLMQFLEVPAGS